MNDSSEKRYYPVKECILIHKTNEFWGPLSNMCRGFPIFLPMVGGHVVLPNSESLYQLARFPDLVSNDGSQYFQEKMAAEINPMKVKMMTKPFRAGFCRPDWDFVKIRIMRYTLRVKWLCNLSRLGPFLLQTGDRNIVEYSKKDDFWGAKPIKEDPGTLCGRNALGRLLMEMREGLRQKETFNWFLYVEPPRIPFFNFAGRRILPLLYESGLESWLLRYASNNFWPNFQWEKPIL